MKHLYLTYIILCLFCSCARGYKNNRTPSSLTTFSPENCNEKLTKIIKEKEHQALLKNVFRVKTHKKHFRDPIIDDYYNAFSTRFGDPTLELRHSLSGKKLKRTSFIPVEFYNKKFSIDIFHRFENREPYSYSAKMFISVVNIIFKDSKKAIKERESFSLFEEYGIKTVGIKLINDIDNKNSLVIKEYIQGSTVKELKDRFNLKENQDIKRIIDDYDKVHKEISDLINSDERLSDLKISPSSLLYWNGQWHLDWLII